MNHYEKKAINEMDTLNETLHQVETCAERRKIYKRMVKLFNHYKILKTLWELHETCHFILNRFVRKIKEIIQKIPENIIVAKGVKLFEDGINAAYLIRIYDKKNILLWSKVGTAEHGILKRMIQHLNTYKEAKKIIIDKTWDCGNLPPQGLESELRAAYIKKFPSAFRKNDRFEGVIFDLNEAEKIAINYLK